MTMNINTSIDVRHILLAEDDPRDAKLTLAALKEPPPIKGDAAAFSKSGTIFSLKKKTADEAGVKS